MARRFDGSAAYLLDGGLNTARVTWSAWVRPRALPASFAGIVGFQDGSGAHDKTLHLLAAGTVRFHGFDGANRNVTSTSVLPVGIWTHVAATADGSNIRVFVNGVQEGVTACGSTFTGFSGACLRIGGGLRESGSTTSRYLDGDISEVGLWSEALTPAQVRRLATGVRYDQFAPASLVAFWPLVGVGAEYDRWPPALGVSGSQFQAQQAGSTWPEFQQPPLLERVVLLGASGPTPPGDIEAPFIAATTQLFEQEMNRPVFVLPLTLRWARN